MNKIYSKLFGRLTYISPCEIYLYSLFLLSAVGCSTNFTLRRSVVREAIVGSPITIAFESIDLIFYSIVCTISVTIPIALELLLDVIMSWRSSIDDSRERLFVVFVISVPGILIFSFNKQDLPFIFSCFHAVQYVGCFGTVLSLCNKLIPNHFTTRKVVFVQFFFSLGSILSLSGFGKPLLSWENISVLACIPLSLGSFFYFLRAWLASLGILNLSKKSYKIFLSLSINEITCLLYISCTLLTIIVIPGVAAATCYLDWQYYNLSVVLIFVYSLMGFSLFPSCIPGRVARYSYMVAERSVAREQASKRSALRYLSHEMRSPLNVICSGIAFVLQDLEHLNVGGEVLENLHDVRHASESAVSLLDDFLNYEKMDSGVFSLTEKYICVEDVVSNVIRPLGVFVRQKGLQFVIASTDQVSVDVGTQDKDPRTDSYALRWHDYDLFVDVQKISQVNYFEDPCTLRVTVPVA